MKEEHPAATEPHYTLEGLGPLSNPKFFRLYAMLCIGVGVYCWTLFIVYGHYLVIAATIVTAFVVSSRLPDIQQRLAPAARVSIRNSLGGWIVGALGVGLYANFTDTLTFWRLVEILGFAAFSTISVYVSVSYRSLRGLMFWNGSG